MRVFYETLSEKDRRRYAAVESRKFGYGSIEYIASVLGCRRRTVENGTLPQEVENIGRNGSVAKFTTMSNVSAQKKPTTLGRLNREAAGRLAVYLSGLKNNPDEFRGKKMERAKRGNSFGRSKIRISLTPKILRCKHHARARIATNRRKNVSGSLEGLQKQARFETGVSV